MVTSSPPLIYAVDDDEDDRYLLKTIFARHHKSCFLRLFDNGSQLLTQLTHELDGRLPDLIILDLSMPLFNGFELLRYLKQDCIYREIPVAILSACQQREYIDRCYSLGTTIYMPKTADYTRMVGHVNYLQQYWQAALIKKWLDKKADKLVSEKPFDWHELSFN